jgi:nucleoside-diphosphate-sugar epimerase
MPEAIQTVSELEENLSRPSETALTAVASLEGDLILLGAGGKMGPTLALMAQRAFQQTGKAGSVVAVSRFTDLAARQRLEDQGVETVSCDLLEPGRLEQLPDAANVIFMTGMKFGASTDPSRTWVMNCHLPALVCQRYQHSRIVAFSSGNVYPMVPIDSQGSTEQDEPAPFGEYSMTVLGRERVFEYFSREFQIPVALLRLNYATELRYGVLVDIALAVWEGRDVDVSTPVFNVIWQRDANAMTLAALAAVRTPAAVINVAGPEILKVRQVAAEFGKRMGKDVRFTGQEATTAYLNDGRCGYRLLGATETNSAEMLNWTADWVKRGGETLGKPTHFQVRSGRF